METNHSIVIEASRFPAEDKEWFGMKYRAYDHIEEANAVMKPYLDNRKEIAKKELQGFEISLTPEDHSDCDRIERHTLALQKWPAFLLFRPSAKIMENCQKVNNKRAELTNRVNNPFVDLEKADGVAMLKSMLEELDKAGFKVSEVKEESNGEYVKETFTLDFKA